MHVARRLVLWVLGVLLLQAMQPHGCWVYGQVAAKGQCLGDGAADVGLVPVVHI